VDSTWKCNVVNRIAVGRQIQNLERFYERAVKKKVLPKPAKVLASQPLNLAEVAQCTLLRLLLIVSCGFVEPDLNSRCRGQF
jgi:hypothetical protein